MKNLNALATVAVATCGLAPACGSAPSVEQKPNIIFILADDLGYGDLGCYGQQIIQTPNIDRLAASGIRFTQSYAGCTVSAPSRCALMTGVHTGHADIRGNRELPGEGQLGIAESSNTVAKVLKEQGYTTGAFGKWGLGAPGGTGDPNNQGFDEFYGYNCQRHAHRYYPEHLWHNQTKVMLPGNEGYREMVTFAPDLIQEQALNFIAENKENPFFAYVAIVQPHAELLAQDDEHFAKYDGKLGEEVPFVAHQEGAEYGDPNFNIMHYASQEKPHATFAAMVSQVDEYVGQIIDAVEAAGIAENTIILFSSDNGPHQEGGADPDFFDSNGPITGYKRSMTDGGIRLPLIASWSGTIKEGQVSDHITAFWDFLPTAAEIAGAPAPVGTDGISYLPTLLGEGKQQQHDYLYWEWQGNLAVRMGDWKAIKMSKKDNVEIYNLIEDIAETNDVAEQHPDLVAKAEQIFKEAHTYNENFPLNDEERGMKKGEGKKK